MFIEQGIKIENEFWKYIIGSLLVILASFIGQVPLLIAVFYKGFVNGKIPKTQQELMTVLDLNLTLFLILISFAFAIVGLFFVIKLFHKQTILSVTTSRPKIDWKRIFFSFSIWSLFSIGTLLITNYFYPNDLVWNFKFIPFAILFVISIIFIPIQTSTEEYIFRGYLMQGFANLAKNKWFPLVMTSIIFGTMHIFNPEIDKLGYIILVYYIGTGLFLGIITLMDEGMELALGFHAANNLLGALLVTADWSVFQTNAIFKDISEPTAGFQIIVPVFIIFPLLIFMFSKKYNWTNWQEKLTGKILNNITKKN